MKKRLAILFAFISIGAGCDLGIGSLAPEPATCGGSESVRCVFGTIGEIGSTAVVKNVRITLGSLSLGSRQIFTSSDTFRFDNIAPGS